MGMYRIIGNSGLVYVGRFHGNLGKEIMESVRDIKQITIYGCATLHPLLHQDTALGSVLFGSREEILEKYQSLDKDLKHDQPILLKSIESHLKLD